MLLLLVMLCFRRERRILRLLLLGPLERMVTRRVQMKVTMPDLAVLRDVVEDSLAPLLQTAVVGAVWLVFEKQIVLS